MEVLMNLTLRHLHLTLCAILEWSTSRSQFVFCAFHTQRIQSKPKMHDQTYRRWIYTTIKEKIPWEHRPSEAWFPSYDLLNKKKCWQCPLGSSRQDIEGLNSDCLTPWKIPSLMCITWNPFCICCCKSWMSLTSVAWRVDFKCSLEIKI